MVIVSLLLLLLIQQCTLTHKGEVLLDFSIAILDKKAVNIYGVSSKKTLLSNVFLEEK
jgi:hypothetical protein